MDLVLQLPSRGTQERILESAEPEPSVPRSGGSDISQVPATTPSSRRQRRNRISLFVYLFIFPFLSLLVLRRAQYLSIPYSWVGGFLVCDLPTGGTEALRSQPPPG